MGTFEEGIAALKAGDRARARKLLAKLLDNEPRNESAWLALSFALESRTQREFCLEVLLEINPSNRYAAAELKRLRSGSRSLAQFASPTVQTPSEPVSPAPRTLPLKPRPSLFLEDDMVGRFLGQYELLALIGKGGMARVYKSIQPALERYVAVKLLHPTVAADEEFLTRFQCEAQAAASLRHPHIVQIFDFGHQEEFYYVVMEFIDGLTLRDELQRLKALDQTLPFGEVQRIIGEVSEGLDYAHDRGIIHRGVKPSNILLAPDGQAVLSDFGLAFMIEGPRQTITGFVGTPEYMSPEQGQGLAVNGRTDVYSLGVVLYEMLTSRLPFTAKTPVGIVMKHISEPLPPPRSVNSNIPEGVEQVLLKAMAKDPQDRYSRAGELSRVLAEAFEAAGVAEAPTAIPVIPAEVPEVVEEPGERLRYAPRPMRRATLPNVPRTAPVVRRATPTAATHPAKPRTRRSLVTSLRRWPHKRLAFVNRLVFYAFIVTLPFDLRMIVPAVSSAPVLLSRVCLLAALVLWLPAKLIEPRRRWYWGWWYVVIPLSLLLFLHASQPFSELLLLVGLYLFVVNELPERAYAEVGLAFAVAVLAQAAGALWQPVGIMFKDSAQGAQLMAVEAFVPLGWRWRVGVG